MGRACLENRENFSFDGLIWGTERKEAFETTTTKMGEQSQERCTIGGFKY